MIPKHGGVSVTHTAPKHPLSSLPSNDQARLRGGHLCYQLSASPRGAHLHHCPRGGHRSNKLRHLLQHLHGPGPPGVLLLSGIRYWPRLGSSLSTRAPPFPEQGLSLSGSCKEYVPCMREVCKMKTPINTPSPLHNTLSPQPNPGQQ